jgi:hypothetical protein
MKIRLRPLAFLPCGLLAFGLLLADIRPGDLEKVDTTEKAAPEGEKGGKDGQAKEQPGPGKRLSLDEHEKLHQKLAAEGDANLKEIARLMEKVQGNLAKKQTGDATQNDQQEIVKRIQELIDKLGKGWSSCGGSGDQSQSNPSGSSASQKQQQKKSGSEQQRAENEKQRIEAEEQAKREQAKKDREKSSGKVPNDRTEQGKMPPADQAKTLAEKAEALERWGVLPKKVVEQMRASNGKDYPAEYRELISRYYERLSKVYEENKR